MTDELGAALAASVVTLADDLRRLGVDVPTSAVLDAVAAVAAIDLGQREQVRIALAATLVKRADDLVAFEAAFARWGRGPATPTMMPPDAPTGVAPGPDRDAVDDDRVRDDLQHALAGEPDAAAMRALAQRAVARWGGLGRVTGSERYHVQRVLRALRLSDLADQAVRARAPASRLDEVTTRTDVDMRLAELRRLVEDEVRSRLDDATRRDVTTARADTPPIDARDVEFLRASQRELVQMRAAVRPLARALAAKLARQQRRKVQGRIDMRHTIRASLGSGGVPIDPVHRSRRRSKPELWLVCDVSGSVAEFARFTLAFVVAVHEELAGVRTFVFVDDVEEITEILDQRLHQLDPFALLVRASASPRRRSDYGRMLRRLLEQHGGELSSRTTVVFTGDARSHDADPGVEHLRELRRRCRQVWFLDPEPSDRWAHADAAAARYADACDRVVEVRNLRQLAAAIDDLLA